MLFSSISSLFQREGGMIQHNITVPAWEKQCLFDPVQALQTIRTTCRWINAKQESLQPPLMWGPSAETIWNNPFTDFDLEYLPLRDPSYFLAGQIHKCPLEWDRLFNQSDMSNPDLMLVRQWIREGVDISALFCHYKGNFKGRSYNSPLPVSFYAPNIPVCQEFGSFIASTLEDRLQDGSLQLWGRVGEVSPPLVVMPIVIERSKPRMCHDERFLNLWIRDCPFTLDTLRHIPSLINHNVLMTTCDEKSAYDNVFIQERYRTYFGLQFGGYYMVYTTLPFGFKASPFIYQTIGMVVTSYLRQHGVPTLQYLDDRFLAAWEPKVTHTSGIKCASIAIYSTCQILSRLGYTLALHKSVIVPTNKLIFLGMHVDSKRQVFSLPTQKREKFALLRGAILQCENISLKTLQRFHGKCVSFMLCVPAAKLFTRCMSAAISASLKNSRLVSIEGPLKDEIAYWSFLDTFDDWIPWRKECHIQLTIHTDSSGFAWGACMGEDTIRDYWSVGDHRPIHIKEADALFKSLCSLSEKIRDSRVDAYVDNQALLWSWEREGARDIRMNGILKQIFFLSMKFNFDLKMHYVSTSDNIADSPSRELSRADCMLSLRYWHMVDNDFGPHTFDLMALDSNAQSSLDGRTLKHYTPWPLPQSDGVNVFSQKLVSAENYYVFPPFCMISALVRFLESFRDHSIRCTMVIPKFHPLPLWWPIVSARCSKLSQLSPSGAPGIVLLPTKKGYIVDTKGRNFELYVARFQW